MEMLNLTVIIHTRNSETLLPQALASVRWADERIVVDMESDDRTCDIARQYGAVVLSTPVAPRIDGIRNQFLDCGRHEWILVLDSDEYLAADAEQVIRNLLEQHGQSCDAFFIPRYNIIAGQIIRGSSWYPDHQVRLFRKGCVRWDDSTHKIAEVLTGKERLHKLEPPGCLHIHHNNYASVEQFIERQCRYALNDVYPEDGFSFESYVAQAYEAFGYRLDEKHDGELSFALATVMAWDRVIRGLIHWERQGRKDSLSKAFSLPVMTLGGYPDYIFPSDVDELRGRLKAYEDGVLWRWSNAFGRRFPRIKNFLSRTLRRLRR